MTPEEITTRLQDDGWAMTSTIIDAGRYDKPSRHAVTVTRNGQAYQTEYTMGAAFRVWSRKAKHASLGGWTQADQKQLGNRPKHGKRVPTYRNAYGGGLTLHHESLLLDLTEPESPELADVMCSLITDSDCVRHGQTFEDFAGDLGYDEDSRKAEAIYNACTDCWRSLVRMGADLDKLSELFQDY